MPTARSRRNLKVVLALLFSLAVVAGIVSYSGMALTALLAIPLGYVMLQLARYSE